MKKILSLLLACATLLSVAAFDVFAAPDPSDEQLVVAENPAAEEEEPATIPAENRVAPGTEKLVVPKGNITVDGKKAAGEWDGAATLTIDASNSFLTMIDEKDETQVDELDKVVLSFKYDSEYLYILEERSSFYLNTEISSTATITVYRGDATDCFFSLYMPDATDAEKQNSTTDVLFTCDSKERTNNKSKPVVLTRSNTSAGNTWGLPRSDKDADVASTVDASRKKATTEVKVRWSTMFQGNSLQGSTRTGYKQFIPEFVAKGGLAIKFAAIVHEGNSSNDHCYSRTYGANVSNADGKQLYGTKPTLDDIDSWVTLYLGEENAAGQINFEAVMAEGHAADHAFPWKTVIIIGIIVLLIVIGVIIVLRVFNFKFVATEVEDDSDDDDDDDDDEDDDDDDDDDDE